MSFKVDQALVGSFLAANFDLPISHENDNSTPVAGAAYVELSVIPTESIAATLRGYDEEIGIFQAIVRYPTDEGSGGAKSKAEQILSHFSLYSTHSHEGQDVVITKHSRGQGYPQDGWYKIVVRMFYRAFTPR